MNRQWPLFPRLAALLLLFFCLGGAPSAAAASVTVYYFHSTARCAECLEIERMVGEVLRQTFSPELADGHLLWRPVNADLPENTHFVFDFDLAANELVVARDTQASHGAWDKLPEVWSLAHDPEQLRAKLVRMVGQALAAAD